MALAPTTLGAAPAAAVATISFNSVPGGPVVIGGNDPADHVSAVGAYIRNVYTNLDANIANGYLSNGKVAVVSTRTAVLDGMGTGEPSEQFGTAAAVDPLFVSIDTNTYKHIHICSDDDNTLDPTVQSAIANWGQAIVAHVNRGGGLFSRGHHYAWLTDLFPALVVTPGGTSTPLTALLTQYTNDGGRRVRIEQGQARQGRQLPHDDQAVLLSS